MLSRLVRMPLLHFAVIGGALQLAVTQWPGGAAAAIPIGHEDLARLQREWRAETGRMPTSVELRASLRRYVDDEILLAEALRLGLDRRDAVVRERLSQNLAFALAQSEAGEAERLEQAQALGMAASDLVARRRLIQLMEQRLVGEIAVDEDRLRAYVSANAARYAPTLQLDFLQVYFSRDRNGDAREQAQAAARQLQADPAADIARLGDPFLFGAQAVAETPDRLARRYGAAFSNALSEAPIGAWIGPLESAYGWHLVRIEQRTAAGTPDFAAVRVRAAYAWYAEEERRVLQQRLLPLRRRYGVASLDARLDGLRS